MERRNQPRPRRTLDDEVLTLHLVIPAVLSGRTTEAHLIRQTRAVHRAARVALGWEVCGLCGDPLPCRSWAIWAGAVHGVETALHLAERLYCSAAHGAWVVMMNCHGPRHPEARS